LGGWWGGDFLNFNKLPVSVKTSTSEVAALTFEAFMREIFKILNLETGIGDPESDVLMILKTERRDST
jgi:hypothetical protein